MTIDNCESGQCPEKGIYRIQPERTTWEPVHGPVKHLCTTHTRELVAANPLAEVYLGGVRYNGRCLGRVDGEYCQERGIVRISNTTAGSDALVCELHKDAVVEHMHDLEIPEFMVEELPFQTV